MTVQSSGLVGGNNTLRVVNDADNVGTYSALFNLSGSGGTFIWPNEFILLRMYAIYAYAIQEGFRGSYSDEDLTVHWRGQTPDACCRRPRARPPSSRGGSTGAVPAEPSSEPPAACQCSPKERAPCR